MKHTEFLRTLKQAQFSGQSVQIDATGQQWSFYLSHGSLLYATGGVHPVKRWRRNLATYCPRIPDFRVAWQRDLAQLDAATFPINWEYALLSRWIEQQRITQIQASQMIGSIVAEVLFDLAQATDITEQIKQESSLSTPLQVIEVDAAIAQAEQPWHLWQNSQLVGYSPNQAPVIRQPDQLQKYSSAQSYQNLVDLLNGEHTLRDLELKMQRSVVEVASSLVPFVQLGWVEFIDIPDLPAPIYRRNPAKQLPSGLPMAPIESSIPQFTEKFIQPTLKPPTHRKEPLVACVDDSSLVLNTMEQLVSSANYEFLGINDPVRAIGSLLTHKPDLIFLDLVMPNGNGYEICEQLRKLSCFRDTPVVILTGNDGYANRLKSKFAGASDFLSKPLDANAVLNIIRKHVPQGAARA